jgi:hypothetical protein
MRAAFTLSPETRCKPLILRDDFLGRRLQCGTGLPACQRLTCVAPGTAIQVSPPNERRRPSAQVASQKPSCFVGQVANLRPIGVPSGPGLLWGSQSWLQPAFSRLLEFLHFSSSSSVNQGLIGDLEAERRE